MESLLNLSIAEFRAVELILRLTVALIGMTALLTLLCVTCTARRSRLPLILSGVALLGAAWFELGVWLAWKEACELAGTSYCVSGHLLAGEDRIIALSLGVPAILLALGMIQMTWGKAGGYLLERLALVLLGLALLAPFSSLIALALTLTAGGILCGLLPARRTRENSPLRTATRVACGLILFSLVISVAGSWRLLPLGKSADAILVRGEIIVGISNIFSLVIPALVLLVGVLKLEEGQAKAV